MRDVVTPARAAAAQRTTIVLVVVCVALGVAVAAPPPPQELQVSKGHTASVEAPAETPRVLHANCKDTAIASATFKGRVVTFHGNAVGKTQCYYDGGGLLQQVVVTVVEK
jgi:hypothetical protein